MAETLGHGGFDGDRRDTGPDLPLRTPARPEPLPIRPVARAVNRDGPPAPTTADDEPLRAERERLARDIHDTLAQGFLGVILHLEAARRQLLSGSDEARRTVEVALHLARASLNDARVAVRDLRADATGTTDLVGDLRRLVRAVADHASTPVWFRTGVARCPLPAAVGAQVGRVVTEAVRNALRHARATRVLVTVGLSPDGTPRVSVEDDGVGFRPTRRPDGRYGLVGMFERAAAVGCALTVHSAPGRGTRVHLHWPAGAASTEGIG